MNNVAKIETHRIAAHVAPARAEPELTLVPSVSAGERAERLYREARAVSLDQVNAMQASLAATQELVQSVADAGDLYAPGLQAFAARFAEELFWRAKTLDGLAARHRAAVLA